MAKRLKKEKVNVDVINFGEEVFLFFLSFWAHTHSNILSVYIVVRTTCTS